MAVQFQCVTRTALPVQELFDRSLSIDAHTASMRHSAERAVAGVRSGQIGLGEQVTWQARHFGLPVRMTSRITALTSPRFFIDEQVTGPFASFHHLHEFHVEQGQTVMVDTVSFRAPFGALGWLVERLILGKYLRKLIEIRNEYLVSNEAVGGKEPR
ncbi:hypothetical protein GCM10027417_14820 [Glutamicibacter endophyticus]